MEIRKGMKINHIACEEDKFKSSYTYSGSSYQDKGLRI